MRVLEINGPGREPAQKRRSRRSHAHGGPESQRNTSGHRTRTPGRFPRGAAIRLQVDQSIRTGGYSQRPCPPAFRPRGTRRKRKTRRFRHRCRVVRDARLPPLLERGAESILRDVPGDADITDDPMRPAMSLGDSILQTASTVRCIIGGRHSYRSHHFRWVRASWDRFRKTSGTTQHFPIQK
jgi:hypothetical protein